MFFERLVTRFMYIITNVEQYMFFSKIVLLSVRRKWSSFASILAHGL